MALFIDFFVEQNYNKIIKDIGGYHMALIICPECGREISDKAPHCIHCGFPLSLIESVQEHEQKQSDQIADDRPIYCLILKEHNKAMAIETMQLISNLTQLSCKESQILMNQEPVEIMRNLTMRHCKEIQKSFNDLHAITCVSIDEKKDADSEVADASNNVKILSEPVYRLVLQDYLHSSAIEMATTISKMTGCGLAVAKSLMDNRPSTIFGNTSIENCTKAKSVFEAMNAIVEISEDRDPSSSQQLLQSYQFPSSKEIESLRSRFDGIIKCPRCGSTSITTGQRGYKITTGFLGSSKTVNRCANCGYSWEPSYRTRNK